MKFAPLSFALLMAVVLVTPLVGPNAWANAGHDHSHASKPMHGGIVVEAKGLDYELVAKPAQIQLHLRNHGKTVDISQASAKLVLLTGTEKQEVELKPMGDKLEAVGVFKVAAGTKVVATVTTQGRPPANIRFVVK